MPWNLLKRRYKPRKWKQNWGISFLI